MINTKTRQAKKNRRPPRRTAAVPRHLCPLDIPRTTTRSGQELKFRAITLVGAFASVGTAGVPIRMSQIAQGLDFTDRIGRSIIIKSFRLDGQLVGGQTNSAVDEQRNVFRIALVEMNAGVALAAATFNVESIIDPRYVPGLKKVHFDQLISLASPGRDSTGYMPACRMVHIPRIPMNVKIDYTSNVATSESGSVLWAWCISDSNAVPNPGFESGAMLTEYVDA